MTIKEKRDFVKALMEFSSKLLGVEMLPINFDSEYINYPTKMGYNQTLRQYEVCEGIFDYCGFGEIIFIATHETRHRWQEKYNKEEYFGNDYKDETNEEYFYQLCEIDANAYAKIFLKEIFRGNTSSHQETENRIKEIRNSFLEMLECVSQKEIYKLFEKFQFARMNWNR